MSKPNDNTTCEEARKVNVSSIKKWEEISVRLSETSRDGKYIALKIDGGDGLNLTQTICIED